MSDQAPQVSGLRGRRGIRLEDLGASLLHGGASGREDGELAGVGCACELAGSLAEDC